MKKVIINTIGGVIREVLSANPDLQIVLLDSDEHDDQAVSEHYVTHVLNNKQFTLLNIEDYVQSMMPKEEEVFTFTMTMTGVNRENAFRKLVASLDPDLIPEEELTTMEMECGICGRIEEVDPDTSDFSPELYLNDHQIGVGVCVACQCNYCIPNHEKGGFDIQIHLIPLSSYPANTALVQYLSRPEPEGGDK